MALKLYTYWRSTAAYRVRIALNLKGLDYEAIPVHLVRDGGEQHKPSYRKVNPLGLVPALIDDGEPLTQSLAIIEYLDERYPDPPLLPSGPLERARARALAQTIACDVHPLNNVRVLRYLVDHVGADDGAKLRWYRHWVDIGFAAIEQQLATLAPGDFCFGDAPTLADICLVPQVYNAERFNCDLTPYPSIRRISAHSLSLPAFDRARPGNQPDA